MVVCAVVVCAVVVCAVIVCAVVVCAVALQVQEWLLGRALCHAWPAILLSTLVLVFCPGICRQARHASLVVRVVECVGADGDAAAGWRLPLPPRALHLGF